MFITSPRFSTVRAWSLGRSLRELLIFFAVCLGASSSPAVANCLRRSKRSSALQRLPVRGSRAFDPGSQFSTELRRAGNSLRTEAFCSRTRHTSYVRLSRLDRHWPHRITDARRSKLASARRPMNALYYNIHRAVGFRAEGQRAGVPCRFPKNGPMPRPPQLAASPPRRCAIGIGKKQGPCGQSVMRGRARCRRHGGRVTARLGIQRALKAGESTAARQSDRRALDFRG
jgi:hypothetical protein